MKVPFIDLKRVASSISETVRARWEGILENTEFVGGPSVAQLEKRLCEDLGVANTICCANGTDALLVALQAMGVSRGDIVAMPNLTFWATYEAAAQLGAVPLLLDVDANLQMDFKGFKAAHRAHGFRFAVVVHLMGWATPRLAELREYCSSNGIELLEDGAQAYGVRLGDQSVFKGARASTLSFYPAKVFGGCMDGGAVFTDDADLADRVRRLCNHGRSAHYGYSDTGWNSRMGGLQAAWLLELHNRMPAILDERRATEAAYAERLAHIADRILVHLPPAGIVGNGYLSVCEVLVSDPDALAAELRTLGIGTGRVYPQPLHVQPPAVNALVFGDQVNSTRFCTRVINLPIFAGMTDEELSYVVSMVEKTLKEAQA